MNITGNTRIMGILGDPIAQISTPNAINPVFRENGADIACVPFFVSRDELHVVWKGLKSLKNLAGLGVTLPHKSQAAILCDRLEGNAKRTGVVNAVLREFDGTMVGEMFDGVSFTGSLIDHGHPVKGTDILMIGAGGVAQAIAFALHDASAASLTILNRTASKADRLASLVNAEVKGRFSSSGFREDFNYDLIINCTSLGLGTLDPLPLDPKFLRPDQVVADVIANPVETNWLKIAKTIGCATHSGIHMIEKQAVLIADFIARREDVGLTT